MGTRERVCARIAGLKASDPQVSRTTWFLYRQRFPRILGSQVGAQTPHSATVNANIIKHPSALLTYY